MDVTRLYKWIWKNYINWCDKTIQKNGKKLYKLMWQNCTNGYDKTLQTDVINSTQINVTQL